MARHLYLAVAMPWWCAAAIEESLHNQSALKTDVKQLWFSHAPVGHLVGRTALKSAVTFRRKVWCLLFQAQAQLVDSASP